MMTHMIMTHTIMTHTIMTHTIMTQYPGNHRVTQFYDYTSRLAQTDRIGRN
jgi:hypothetical protein